jgi:nucleoid-associated protein YgaU
MARAGRRVALIAAALAVAAIAGCLPGSIRPTPVPPPTPSPSPSPSPSPTPTPAPPTPTPGPSFTLHTVVRGDSLSSIARKYDTSGRSIAYWNRDEYPSLDPESANYDPNGIKRGWVLRLLPGEEYVPPPDDGETGESPTPSPPDDEYESAAP